MSLETQTETTELKLDFEDLVKELDQFEQEAVELQSRISSFMAAATEAARGPEEAPEDGAGTTSPAAADASGGEPDPPLAAAAD